MGVTSPSPTPAPTTTQGSSAHTSPHKSPQLLAQKLVGIESVEETAGAPSSSFKRTHTWTYLLRLFPSGIQRWGSSLEGTIGVLGETEVSGIGGTKGHCPFSGPSPHRATELAGWCHILSNHLGGPQRLHPT